MANRFLRLAELQERIGMSRTWIYTQIASGKFPAPVKIGASASGWVESEIDAWIEERAAARVVA